MKSCKIIIKDEVNAKLDGVTPEDRRTLTKRFSFEIPGARYLPAVRLGRWDGRVSYFSVAGSTFINLLPEIIPYLDERGYDVELEDLRDYSSSFAFNTIDEATFSHKVWPTGHPVAGQPVVLRDYQIEVVNNFLTNTQSIQEVATGAGKTLITAALSYSCESFGRTIIIVPNKSLVAQTEADYRNLGLDVGVYYGDRKEFGKTHTICTWQSLNNLLKNTKSGADIDITIGEFIEGVNAIIIDECFSGEMRVLTTMGYVPIREIKVGDTIVNYSENDGKFKIDTVVKTHKNLVHGMNEKMYEMEMDDGAKIRVTGNHKFLTTAGWVRADELTENHEIISKK
jgi:hypothetical protein